MLTLLLLMLAARADDAHPFTCCDDAAVEGLVGAWLDTAEQLAAGKPHADAMARLAAASKSTSRAADRPAFAIVHAEAERLSGLSLAAARADLGPLARHVLWLALHHESGSLKVVQATCPGVGSWLQRDRKSAQNPYGSRCGALR